MFSFAVSAGKGAAQGASPCFIYPHLTKNSKEENLKGKEV
jgi:hypothetical protein